MSVFSGGVGWRFVVWFFSRVGGRVDTGAVFTVAFLFVICWFCLCRKLGYRLESREWGSFAVLNFGCGSWFWYFRGVFVILGIGGIWKCGFRKFRKGF